MTNYAKNYVSTIYQRVDRWALSCRPPAWPLPIYCSYNVLNSVSEFLGPSGFLLFQRAKLCVLAFRLQAGGLEPTLYWDACWNCFGHENVNIYINLYTWRTDTISNDVIMLWKISKEVLQDVTTDSTRLTACVPVCQSSLQCRLKMFCLRSLEAPCRNY